MSEVDPDPHVDEQGAAELGGRPAPGTGDPTDGGRHGEIGAVPSIEADEPDEPAGYAVGGGRVGEEQDAPPVADPGA